MGNWIKKMIDSVLGTPEVLPEPEEAKPAPKKSRGHPKKINKIEPKDK
jgi:hypothetical protein